VLEQAPLVPVSSRTGEGLDELAVALDRMLELAPPPPQGRTRLFIDRVFTIKGAGTVVTGTLTGGNLRVGEEVDVYPTAGRARIRGLQTHKTREEEAGPVTRVAANLVGVDKERVRRGYVIGEPALWRPSTIFDASVAPVRGLDAIPSKGAYKVYVGAAESDALIQLAVSSDGIMFLRARTREPLVLDVGDRFVLREAGRRATVGGGTVLQVAPPRGFAQPEHLEMLARRRHALQEGPTPEARELLARLTVEESGAVRARDLQRVTGAAPPRDLHSGTWCVAPGLRDRVTATVTRMLEHHHAEHPLEEGAGLADVRDAAAGVLREAGAPGDPALIDALLDEMPGVYRSATAVRAQAHSVDLAEEDLARLLSAIGETPTPPTVPELLAAGIPRDLMDAAARQGAVVRISETIVLRKAFVEDAIALVRERTDGVTVSALREALGTSRKYALPLAEWMDRQKITRREGDLRFLRQE
jgi:selenocysteine-specific elongation factor